MRQQLALLLPVTPAKTAWPWEPAAAPPGYLAPTSWPSLAALLLCAMAAAALLLRQLCRRAPSPRSFSATPADGGFIAAAKAGGTNALLGAFLATNGRFDGSLRGLEVREVGGGRVLCALPALPERLLNAYATLHGGAAATLVDVVGTLALLSLDPARPGVSVELSLSFLAPAPAGATVWVEGKVLKAGKRLGFTQVDIWHTHADGNGPRVDVATGRHTKSLG